MNKERTVITQQLCDHVKALLAGKLTHKKAAEFTRIGKATVDRIVAAGFNAEQYAKNTAARKEEKKAAEEQKPAARYGCVYTGHIEMPQTGIELTPEGPVNRETITKVREELKKYTDENQVPGQMEMDLQPAEEQEEYVDVNMKVKKDGRVAVVNQEKIIEKLDAIFIGMEGMHRYRAGKTDLLNKTLGIMLEKLDKINDTMYQILRRMDK